MCNLNFQLTWEIRIHPGIAVLSLTNNLADCGGQREKYFPKSHLINLENEKIQLWHTGLISLCLATATNPMGPHCTVPIAGSSISSWSGTFTSSWVTEVQPAALSKETGAVSICLFHPTVQRKQISLICHKIVFVPVRLPQLRGLQVVKHSDSVTMAS